MLSLVMIAMYLRVSTRQQKLGLESQRRALEQFCIDKGFENIKKFEDFGISGTKCRRPGLDQLMSLVEQGHVSHVIVYSFSRFARSTSHLLSVLDKFNKLGVHFISICESVDTSTPTGKMIFTVLASVAELERELIVERVKCGLENAKAKGKKLGRPKSRNSALILELHKEGLTQRRIAKLAGCSTWSVNQEIKEFGK